MDCNWSWLSFAAGLWFGLLVTFLYSLSIYRRLKGIVAILRREKGTRG